MKTVVCVVTILFLLFSGSAIAEPVYPDVAIHDENGETSVRGWKDAVWWELLRGKRFEKIEFLDPGHPEYVIHTLSVNFDGDSPYSVTLDGKVSFYFENHYKRVAALTEKMIAEGTEENLKENDEYLEAVKVETEVTANEFLAFLEANSAYFKVQVLFDPTRTKKAISKDGLSVVNEWTATGVGAILDLMSTALFVNTFASIPEPLSPIASIKLAKWARHKFVLANEIRRRLGLKLKRPHRPYGQRLWHFVESEAKPRWEKFMHWYYYMGLAVDEIHSIKSFGRECVRILQGLRK